MYKYCTMRIILAVDTKCIIGIVYILFVTTNYPYLLVGINNQSLLKQSFFLEQHELQSNFHFGNFIVFIVVKT